jgi:hypothetical protein
VALDGRVLDAEPIKVAVGPGTQALPDVASDGSGFLVVWQAIPDGDKKNLYRSYAAPVSAEGKVGAAVDTGADRPQPRVAWDGKNYQLAAGVSTSISVWLLGPDGKPRSKGIGVIGYGGDNFSLSAQPGRGALLVADRVKGDAWGWGGPTAIRCSLITSEGKLASPWEGQYPKFGPKDNTWLDSSPYEGEKDPVEANRSPWGDTAGAWDGQHSVVVWQRYHVSRRGYVIPMDNSEIMVSRVDQWVPLDQPIPVAATPLEEKSPALASDGAGRLLCVYTRSGAADGKIQVAARTLTTEKVAPPPAVKDADKKEGLVLWWKCDEGRGAKINDASGNGNSGTLARAPAWVAGKVGGAVELEYDKASSYAITIDGVKNLNAGKGAHTVAAWIKVTRLPAETAQILGLIGSQGRRCSVHGWFVDKTGEASFGAATPIDCEDQSCPKPSVTAKTRLVVGEWKHVAVTYDGTTLTAYLDGQPAGSAQSKFEPLGATQNLALLMRFAQPREKRLACQIGDVRVYSRALSAEEVATLGTAAK